MTDGSGEWRSELAKFGAPAEAPVPTKKNRYAVAVATLVYPSLAVFALFAKTVLWKLASLVSILR